LIHQANPNTTVHILHEKRLFVIIIMHPNQDSRTQATKHQPSNYISFILLRKNPDFQLPIISRQLKLNQRQKSNYLCLPPAIPCHFAASTS
jgi:hypothetical protein